MSNRILNYIRSLDFELCEAGHFSKNKLEELKNVKSIMNKHKDFILDFNRKIDANRKQTTDKDGSITTDLIVILRVEKEEEEIFNKSKIFQLENKELAALVMGLYFSRPDSGECIGNLSWFESWRLEDLKNKIFNRTQLFEDAYKNLCAQIEYIEEILENRL